MAATWTNVFVEQPTDGQTVWVTRIPWFDTPFQATYNKTPLTFSYFDDLTNQVDIPIWEIFKWRDV